MKQFMNFIGGEFVATGKTFENRAPVDNGLIGLVHEAGAAEVDAAQGHIEAARAMLNSYGQIPTIKAVLAERDGDDGWSRLRPPLMPFAAEKLGELRERVAALPSAS